MFPNCIYRFGRQIKKKTIQQKTNEEKPRKMSSEQHYS